MIPINSHLGDMNEFLEDNMRLVHSVAKKFIKAIMQNPSIGDYDDLVSLGTIGLMKAYQKFDPAYGEGLDGKGIKFSTYGVPMIFGEIRRHLRDHDTTLKFGRNYKSAYYKIYGVDPELFFSADTKDIMERTGLSEDDVKKAMEYFTYNHVASLDVPTNDGESKLILLGDTVGYDVDYDTSIVLDEFLSTLSPAHQKVFRMSKTLTQSEIGKKMGLSQVQISRILQSIEQKAIRYGEQSRLSEVQSFSCRAG